MAWTWDEQTCRHRCPVQFPSLSQSAHLRHAAFLPACRNFHAVPVPVAVSQPLFNSMQACATGWVHFAPGLSIYEEHIPRNSSIQLHDQAEAIPLRPCRFARSVRLFAFIVGQPHVELWLRQRILHNRLAHVTATVAASKRIGTMPFVDFTQTFVTGVANERSSRPAADLHWQWFLYCLRWQNMSHGLLLWTTFITPSACPLQAGLVHEGRHGNYNYRSCAEWEWCQNGWPAADRSSGGLVIRQWTHAEGTKALLISRLVITDDIAQRNPVLPAQMIMCSWTPCLMSS